VAALETTLPHCFPSPTPAPPLQANRHRPRHRAAAHQEEEDDDPPSPPPRRARGGRPPPPPPSEWELAARTIQEHFRRFLARRSRTLRQLKELAILRSKAASLRGSLSGTGRRRCKDPVAVSEAAMGLLLHLDGIQVMQCNHDLRSLTSLCMLLLVRLIDVDFFRIREGTR
jgi:hypothetical protein